MLLLESNQIGTVTFEGSTKYVAADAFMNSTGIKLVYKKGIKEAQTELSYDYIIARKNGNNKVRTTWQPVSGANGYQLKFSTDKKFKKVLENSNGQEKCVKCYNICKE